MKVTEFPTRELFEYYKAIATAASYAEETERNELWEQLYGVAMELENELRDRKHPDFI